MRIFEIPISKILIFNWDDSLNGKSDRCPMLGNGCRYREYGSNGRIIEVSSRNIDAYIFLVL